MRWISARDYQTDISLVDSKAGRYSIHAYITIEGKSIFLQAISIDITRPAPSMTAKISQIGLLDIAIHNISPDVQEVLVPTWSNVNGQDDIKWYKAQRQTDGTYSLRVYLKDHHFNTGAYSIHVYTKDAQGRQNFVTNTSIQIGNQDVPSKPQPDIALENLQAIHGRYQVAVYETASSKPIRSVEVASWSMEKQANLIWRTASLENGKYLVAVDFQEQQNHSGNYHNHVYVTYTDGSRVGYASQIVDLTSARLPLKFSTHLAKIGQIQVTLSNVYDHQDLQFAVWSDENGQDDLRWYSAKKTADRTYLADVLLNQHKGVGKYHVHAYQGGKGLGAYSMMVSNSDRYSSNNTYPIGQCTWGAKEVAPWVGNFWGNANQWPASAQRAGFRIGNRPQVGAIAVWPAGQYGHVAVVTAIDSSGRIRVQESNYAGNMSIGDYRGWFNPVTNGITTYIYPH